MIEKRATLWFIAQHKILSMILFLYENIQIYVELKWVEKERHETIILFLTVESSNRNETIANAHIVQKTIISFFEY